MASKSTTPEKKSPLGDTIFAIVHLVVLIAILVYAIVLLVLGNARRSVVILGCLVLYYVLVLHKPVIKEIQRRRNKKSAAQKGTLKK
jgi:FlaA1/EpsC-like NDP-sugar epimerase